VQVVNGRLRLIIRGRLEYQGKAYDGGDWRMDIDQETVSPKVLEVRTGIRSEWTAVEPPYRNNDGSFCFGSSYSEICEHLARGQYAQAVALASTCINTINDGAENLTPRVYKEA
jgi:hypothetical protein